LGEVTITKGQAGIELGRLEESLEPIQKRNARTFARSNGFALNAKSSARKMGLLKRRPGW